MTLSLLRGGYAAGNRMSMHTVKKDSWNRTLSAVDLPKAFDRSNAHLWPRLSGSGPVCFDSAD
jgi:hypothetical protein